MDGGDILAQADMCFFFHMFIAQKFRYTFITVCLSNEHILLSVFIYMAHPPLIPK